MRGIRDSLKLRKCSLAGADSDGENRGREVDGLEEARGRRVGDVPVM